MAFSENQRLVFAARAGNSEEVLRLIAEGASPDGPKDDSGAPLFAALAARQSKVVRVLLEQGASVAVTDQFGEGPLEYALHHQDDRSVFELLTHGAKLQPHVKDTYRILLEQALKRRETYNS